jgi:hypothetical protein
MESVQSDSQCLHPGCKCSNSPNDDFCSDYCASEKSVEAECQCGHPECVE